VIFKRITRAIVLAVAIAASVGGYALIGSASANAATVPAVASAHHRAGNLARCDRAIANVVNGNTPTGTANVGTPNLLVNVACRGDRLTRSQHHRAVDFARWYTNVLAS
jgi:hypothetical protein